MKLYEMERGGQSAFFLKAVPGTGLPDILVGELKEFKDIDYLIITFFPSTLKVVNSLFHTLSPASREMNFRTVIKLKSID